MAMPARCASLPRTEAAAIYRRLYWLRPRFDQVARRSERIAAELFDTGVNMGPAVATTFLQRALTALNRNAKDYADLTPGRTRRSADAACARRLPRLARQARRGDRAPACPRGAPGRAIPSPRRAAASQRGIPLRLAREPHRHNRLIGEPRTSVSTFVNFRRMNDAFLKRSSGRFRSCSTRSSPTRRRGTEPSWSC